MRAALGLDDEAAAAAGDLVDGLRLDDLRQAGWRVTGPRKEGDGLTWVRLAKPFSRPDEADTALAELSGESGCLRDLRFTSRRSLLRTRSAFTGRVDLSQGLACVGDADLQRAVGDVARLDAGSLRARFGDRLDEAFALEVTARLPGSVRGNGTAVGDAVRWTAEVGDSLTLDATAQAWELRPVVPAVVALGSAAAAAAVVLSRRRRRRVDGDDLAGPDRDDELDGGGEGDGRDERDWDIFGDRRLSGRDDR